MYRKGLKLGYRNHKKGVFTAKWLKMLAEIGISKIPLKKVEIFMKMK